MKLTTTLSTTTLFLVSALSPTNAFSLLPTLRSLRTALTDRPTHPTALHSTPSPRQPTEDDEATAALRERVRSLLSTTPTMLTRSTPMPPSTPALKSALATGADHDTLFVSFLTFFMDLKLDYDADEEDGDRFRPTVHPCTDPTDAVTKERLPMLFVTACDMMEGRRPELKLGIWRLVVDKLAARVGMENEAFRDWCMESLREEVEE